MDSNDDTQMPESERSDTLRLPGLDVDEDGRFRIPKWAAEQRGLVRDSIVKFRVETEDDQETLDRPLRSGRLVTIPSNVRRDLGIDGDEEVDVEILT